MPGKHDSDNRYLRPDVVVEPLIDQWYAWHQLIPPATLAMNLVERHLKIMESYVLAPATHAAAVKNPAMLGGPFVNYPTPRVDEIAALIARTRDRRRALIDLHAAVRALGQLLAREARGASLEPLYAEVPEVLRGYVELVYDLDNRPTFRLLENLLYRSPLYDQSSQSVLLSLLAGDQRPFILSTPRLPDPDSVHLPVPLSHQGLDRLFACAYDPAPPGHIGELLGLENGTAGRLEQFFTGHGPRPRQPYGGPGVRLRYFGHACVLLETAHTSVLIDPVISYTYPTDIPRFTFDDLPRSSRSPESPGFAKSIDYVLITHAHADHVMLETLLRLRHIVGTVIVPRNRVGALQDPSLKSALSAIGFPDVRELDHLERIEISGGAITGLPFIGEHGDLDIASKLAYHIDLGGTSMVFAADSCNLDSELYRHLRRVLGDVDILFLGMECDGAPLSWIYGPLLAQPLTRRHDQSRRLAGSDYHRALGIVEALGCREVYVYAMGQEPWLGYVMSVNYTAESAPIVASDQLLTTCAQRGLRAERLYARKERIWAS